MNRQNSSVTDREGKAGLHQGRRRQTTYLEENDVVRTAERSASLLQDLTDGIDLKANERERVQRIIFVTSIGARKNSVR
jgi:hypothetical protein